MYKTKWIPLKEENFPLLSKKEKSSLNCYFINYLGMKIRIKTNVEALIYALGIEFSDHIDDQGQQELSLLYLVDKKYSNKYHGFFREDDYSNYIFNGISSYGLFRSVLAGCISRKLLKKGFVPFHGLSFIHNNIGTVRMAGRGVGKTTLAIWLVQNGGMTLLSDDWGFLHKDSSGTVSAFSFGSALCLRPNEIESLNINLSNTEFVILNDVGKIPITKKMLPTLDMTTHAKVKIVEVFTDNEKVIAQNLFLFYNKILEHVPLTNNDQKELKKHFDQIGFKHCLLENGRFPPFEVLSDYSSHKQQYQ